MSEKNFSSRRRRGGMRFRPSGGMSHPQQRADRGASEARAEALEGKPAEEAVFDKGRHEREIERSENVAAGLPVNASIEEFDQTQGLKIVNGAQATTIPGVDLASLPVAKRTEALQKLNAQPCTCGCDLTVARCRVDDPTCGVSLPLAQQIVKQIARTP